MAASRNCQKRRHFDIEGASATRRRERLAEARFSDEERAWRTPGGKPQVRAERRRQEAAEMKAASVNNGDQAQGN